MLAAGKGAPWPRAGPPFSRVALAPPGALLAGSESPAGRLAACWGLGPDAGRRMRQLPGAGEAPVALCSPQDEERGPEPRRARCGRRQ